MAVVPADDVSETIYLRDPFSWRGRVEMRPLDSRALAGNPLGDPHVREVPVYLPPGHDAPGARFPVIVVLAGFTSRGQRMLDTDPWKPGVVHAYDRAVAEGRAAPAILVLPDAFTRLGGSQYVDSAGVGRYATYVADEIVSFVDETYPTPPGRRGVAGKSSGGFGALHLAMQRPGRFRAAAAIAPDCHFELSVASSFLPALRGLLRHGGDPARFLAAFHAKPELSGDGHAMIELCALSACYSPAPGTPLGFELPVDPATGERVPRVWQRWLDHDPLHACERHADALRALEWLRLECGLADEFHLQFALRALVRKLRSLDIACEHEEFAGGHFDTNERWPPVLDRMARVLAR